MALKLLLIIFDLLAFLLKRRRRSRRYFQLENAEFSLLSKISFVIFGQLLLWLIMMMMMMKIDKQQYSNSTQPNPTHLISTQMRIIYINRMVFLFGQTNRRNSKYFSRFFLVHSLPFSFTSLSIYLYLSVSLLRLFGPALKLFCFCHQFRIR